MQINTHFTEIEPTIFEATLTLDLTNKAGEKVVWEIQLKQAGIFIIEGFSKEQLELTLYGFCMDLLYPYACECASNIAVRGGFLPVYLTPINFENLYREQKRKQAEQKQEANS
jgi:preprotein translocase subunit SecB